MPLKFLDNICVTLTGRLGQGDTTLPLSAGDKSRLCDLLGDADYSYLTMTTNAGSEIIRVSCVEGQIVARRAQGDTTALVGPINTCLCFKVNQLVIDEHNPPGYCQPTIVTATPNWIEIVPPEEDECEWTVNIHPDIIARLDVCCPENPDECGNCTVADGVYENATVTIINGKICGISNGTNIVYTGGGCGCCGD